MKPPLKILVLKQPVEGTEKSIKKTVDAVPESAIERLGKASHHCLVVSELLVFAMF